MTPGELLIDVLANNEPDEMMSAIVIFRRMDGSICYRCDSSTQAPDVLGTLRLVQLSVETDLKHAWGDR